MKQAESVFREILFQAMEKKSFSLTQSDLSKKLSLSLSTVNSAVKKLEALGAVKIYQRGFKVLDPKKILYFWASLRSLGKDVIFAARVEAPVREIEKTMPDIIFTAYTAYKLRFNDVPADYSEVYAYADEKELAEVKKRISKMKTGSQNPNLFILKKDASIELYRQATDAQFFADLWNLKEWYAKEFINALEKRIG